MATPTLHLSVSSIAENLPSGTLLGKVTLDDGSSATDSLIVLETRPTYESALGSGRILIGYIHYTSEHFKISDGNLYSITPLDYEGLNSVKFKILQSDVDIYEDYYFEDFSPSDQNVFVISATDIDEMVDGTGRGDRFIGTDLRDEFDGLNGNDTLKGLGGTDKLLGSNGNDKLYGGSESDILNGGAGSDFLSGGNDASFLHRYYLEDDGIFYYRPNYITGGSGADILYREKTSNLQITAAMDDVGNGYNDKTATGFDVFIFRSIKDSTPTDADAIRGYSRTGLKNDFDIYGIDANDHKIFAVRLDVSAIDANKNISGNQSFKWIGEREFSGKAGQMRVDHAQGDTLVLGDVNGDGQADFMVRILATVDLERGHFIL